MILHFAVCDENTFYSLVLEANSQPDFPFTNLRQPDPGQICLHFLRK